MSTEVSRIIPQSLSNLLSCNLKHRCCITLPQEVLVFSLQQRLPQSSQKSMQNLQRVVSLKRGLKEFFSHQKESIKRLKLMLPLRGCYFRCLLILSCPLSIDFCGSLIWKSGIGFPCISWFLFGQKIPLPLGLLVLLQRFVPPQSGHYQEIRQ